MLNNLVSLFYKKASGFIFPVEQFIKFHYSAKLQYTFLVIVKPNVLLTPFKDERPYLVRDLHFLIVDNEPEGNVTEISESWINLMEQMDISTDDFDI
jgi:hypothetical protein